METNESAGKQPYMGDLNNTQIVGELFQIPQDKRDEGWVKKFLASVATASFKSGDPQVIKGPDGFPYFALYLPEPHKEFQCFVIQHMKDDFLLERGLGVVVQPEGPSAQWVFSYGDILNYHLCGEFYSDPPQAEEPPENSPQNTEAQKVLVGQPAENYLPKVSRAVLHSYLASFNIQDPKILIMMRPAAAPAPEAMIQELVFRLSPEMFQSQQQYENILRSLAWFLPRHYRYVSMGSGSTFETSFAAL